MPRTAKCAGIHTVGALGFQLAVASKEQMDIPRSRHEKVGLQNVLESEPGLEYYMPLLRGASKI